MKRTLVIRTEIARLHTELAKAKAARDAAVRAVAKEPMDTALHDAMQAACCAVDPIQQRLDGLETALVAAEAHDRADDLAAKRDTVIAARKTAREIVLERKPIAEKLQAAIVEIGKLLSALDEVNNRALPAIADAAIDVLPQNDQNMQQLLTSCAQHLHAPLRQQFVLAMRDAGLGQIGFNLGGALEFTADPSELAHTPRKPFGATVEQSAKTIDGILDRIHRATGVTGEAADA